VEGGLGRVGERGGWVVGTMYFSGYLPGMEGGKLMGLLVRVLGKDLDFHSE